MRWSLTETPETLIERAGRKFLELDAAIHANIVIASLTVREEEKVADVMRRRSLEQNQNFMNDFDEWLVDNGIYRAPANEMDGALEDLAELVKILNQ